MNEKVTQRDFIIKMSRYFSYLSKYTKIVKSSGFEMIVPKKFSPDYMNLSPGYDFSVLNTGISDPLYDLLERGGKNWRAMLCLIISDMFKLNLTRMIPLSQVIETIHNGTLIHDDIEDNSQMRRGKPCLHLGWGMDIAVNAGVWIHFASILSLYKAGFTKEITEDLVKCTIEEASLVHVGQATDIEWNRTGHIPTEEQYLLMITNKTSVLVRMAVRYPAIVAKASNDKTKALINFADNLGIYFQIVDDVINLTSEEYAKGRSYVGEDITEGKKTMIVLRAMQQRPDKAQRLADILKKRTSDLEIVGEALGIIKGTDAVEYSLDLGKRKINESWKEIDRLFEDSEAKSGLFELFTQLGDRRK